MLSLSEYSDNFSMSFPSDLAKWAKDQTIGAFTDAVDRIDSGVPNYIRDGQPDSWIGRIDLDTQRRICRKWARQTDGMTASANEGYARVCRPYLESIGEMPNDPTLEYPFQGGQCPNVPYNVYAARTRGTDEPDSCIEDGEILLAANLPGPIRGFRTASNTTGPPNYVPTIQWWLQYADTEMNLGGFFTGCPTAGFSDMRVVRADGLPDDCGNPGVDYEPPDPIDTPLPPSNPPGTPPGFTIDVEIGPGGDITIIFDGEGEPTPTDPFDPFVPTPPELPPIPPKPWEPDEPGDIGEPGDSSDTGESGDTGEVCSTDYLIGVGLELITEPPWANIQFIGDNPVYRGSVYVYLGTSGNLDLQPEGAFFSPNQFFFAPEGSNCFRVAANRGYNFRVTPYYKPAED